MKKSVWIAALLFGTNAFGQAMPRTAPSPAAFVPAGYVISEQIQGDLNKDNQPDQVLLIKATDKTAFVQDAHRGTLDRNRRGLLVALKNTDHYELVLAHHDCFSSENEDGGVYFPPELGLDIQKGNLLVHYAHGRYGAWTYTFRYRNAEFELIGYDNDQNRGPITEKSVSINFLTKKMRVRENLNPDANDSGDEKFRETWQTFTLSRPARLRDIADFDEFNVMSLLGPAR